MLFWQKMNKGLSYKEFTFYVIETKEDFFLHANNRLYSGFKNHRLLKILNVNTRDNIIKFYGSKSELVYQSTIDGFDECVTILHKFKINPN